LYVALHFFFLSAGPGSALPPLIPPIFITQPPNRSLFPAGQPTHNPHNPIDQRLQVNIAIFILNLSLF
jgi:hypothetical protein